MTTILLLTSVTLLYAGYNLLVKILSEHVPNLATSTVLATNCLQIAALVVSSIFAIYLLSRGGQILSCPGQLFLGRRWLDCVSVLPK